MAPGTLVTGQRGTSNINPDQRRIDMADKILLLEPDAAPLTVLTKNIKKKPTINPKFQWQEDELDPRFDATTSTATNSATTFTVANPTYFYPQQMIYVPRTGESMRVVSIASSTLTVVRAIGSTGQALNNGEEILLANSAQPEGDASKPARSRNPATVYNYTQIFRTEWDATETETHSEFETDDDWDYQALKHGIEHKKDIEYALMVGHPSEDTSSGQARRTTGGFKHFVATNATDAGGTFTDTELFAALRPNFRYGSKEKWGFASALVVDVMNGFARGKLEINNQAEKVFGMRVFQYISPHGTLNLVTHWLLEGGTLGGQLWILDPDVVKWRYLQNKRGSRDSHINMEIQAPDVDGRKDEWKTEGGMEFGLEKRHGYVYNITG